MVPLLSLGVPLHVVMAMLLGAFVIHGIQPGPFFIKEHPDIFLGLIASMYIGNAMLLISMFFLKVVQKRGFFDKK